MANELAKTNDQLPAYLQGQGKQAKIGNVDNSDLIIPRVKLLQGTSPEVESFNNAKAGLFWHNLAELPMGDTLLGIPILFRKSFVLWSPRNDERGILARASDGIHWDNWQNEDGSPKEFQVKPKGSPKTITYTLARTVAESGLDQFGPNNEPPAASLTYNWMWYFPELPELSPAIIINTRTAVKKSKQLISKIELRPVDHYAQLFRIGTTKETIDGDEFWNYTYTAEGYAQQHDFEVAKSMFERYGDANFRTDEREDTDGGAGVGHSRGGAADSDKF